jgi:hypothetical protein
MTYNQLTLEIVEQELGITLSETMGLFAQIPEIEYSNFLKECLTEFVPLALAINTGKSRSELIIMPILVELRKHFKSQISLFSGKEFNVAPERGLTGFCDFLISLSPEQLLIKAPIVTLVEAKNDNIQSGLGQCIAEMVAAQLFNQQHNTLIQTVYGCVTTGTNWKFMQLQETTVEIDLNEYFLNDIGKILGILSHFLE